MPDQRNPNLEPIRPEREAQSSRPEPPSAARPSRPDRGDSPGPQSPRPAGGGEGTTPPGPSGGSGAGSGSGAKADKPKSATRRTVLSLLGVGVLAAVLVPTIFHSTKSSLPEPAGQVMDNAEFRAATLKFKPAPATPMPEDHSSWSTCVVGAPAPKLSDMDLVLVIDTTGSMGGVIDDVKASVNQLLTTLRTGGGNVRVGVVAYRDVGDDYLVKQYPLTDITSGMGGLTAFVGGLSAFGGGDWPEKMDAGIETAIAMDWRTGVPGSIVVIGDAPAHQGDQSTAMSDASGFHKGAGRAISVIDAGSGANTFMQALPSSGGGQYVTYDGHILNSLFPAITGCDSH